MQTLQPVLRQSRRIYRRRKMPRAEAAQAVAELGAHVKSAVSQDGLSGRGAQDPALVGAGGRSGKEEKAAALNESGQGKIEILDEAAFRALLAQARRQ
ncbi:MAG: hypothetical protein ACLR7U_06565 [Ruthenibacterium lactatiformans]